MQTATTPSVLPTSPGASRRLALGLCLAGVLGGVSVAQTVERESSPLPGAERAVSAPSQSHGLTVQNGVPLAGGDRYRARFEAGRMEYTPALGASAPVALPLAFQLESITRGSHVLPRAAVPPLARAGANDVVFNHPGGIVERYEVRADGLHQTFLFPEPLPGSGDLVVRGRLETDLAFAGEGPAHGLLFELPGVGGVSIGAVTGIDANGVEAAGGLRYADGFLELSLPGDFVASASYPLLLDPLVGTEIEVAGGSFDNGDPAVAFDSSELTYLVTWERTFADGDTSVRGQRLSNTGALLDSLLFLSSPGRTASNPAVGVVSANDRFFVAWQEYVNAGDPAQIVGRAVDASTGLLSPQIDVAPSPSSQIEPAVGGERTDGDDEVVVVWAEGGDEIRARQINVPAHGEDPTPFLPAVVLDDLPNQFKVRPTLSRSAGDAGRFLIAWERIEVAGTQPLQIFGQVYDRNLTPLGSGIQLLSDPASDLAATCPSVDGDGTNFLLVWERQENPAFLDHDVVGRSLSFQDGDLQLVTPVVPVEDDLGDDEYSPQVAYTGENAVVIYLDVDLGSVNVYARTLDLFTCFECEDEFVLQNGLGVEAHSVGIGSMWSGGDTPGFADDVLMVWESQAAGDENSELLAIRYDSQNPNVDLGGDCGTGGESYAPCASEGNALFTISLRDAQPNAQAFLVTSLNSAPLPCGSCTLFPALDGSATLFTVTTDALGNAAVSIPLPAGLAGVQAVSQWAVRSAGGPCPWLGGLDLSNALQTTFQ